MHDRKSKPIPALAEVPTGSAHHVFTAADLGRFLRLRRWTMTIPIVLALSVAYAYLQVAVPIYSARAQIIINPRLPQFIPGHSEETVMAWDSAQVESEIAVLQSERIAGAVVTKLGLADAADFRGSPSLAEKLRALFSFGDPLEPSQRNHFREALSLVQKGLSVRRTGLSYAIDISFGFTDAQRATDIANATAEAYIADQIESRSEAARVGGEWLQQRMLLLRSQMNAAALAVQIFRASHNYAIPKPGTGEGAGSEEQGPEPANAGKPGSEQKTLNELDASASTYRRIYESFLQSFTESVQRQSFPVSDARVITPASLPKFRSSPRVGLIYALAVLLGGLLGCSMAVLRHHLDQTIRSAAQIIDATGLDELGHIPPLRRGVAATVIGRVNRFLAARRSPCPMRSGEVIRQHMTSGRRLWPSGHGSFFVPVLDAPHSPFGRAMLTLKTLIDIAGRSRPVKCLGLTAPHGHAGTSTITSNLGSLFAESGLRTLIVDADLCGRTLTRRVGDRHEFGLLDVLSNNAKATDAIVPLLGDKLDFLPATGTETSAETNSIAIETMDILLQTFAKTYDVVLLDLPSLFPVGDVLSLAGYLDGIVLVAKWGETKLDKIASSSAYLGRAEARILGFVLNKAES